MGKWIIYTDSYNLYLQITERCLNLCGTEDDFSHDSLCSVQASVKLQIYSENDSFSGIYERVKVTWRIAVTVMFNNI